MFNDKNLNAQIGQRIRAFRTFRKLSQEEFADRLSMSKRTFQKLETGETDIDIPQLERIAEALETTVFDILGMNQGKFFFAYNGQQVNEGDGNLTLNQNEKVQFLEEKVSLLESKIEDQQEIISLLREKLAKVEG